MSAILAGGNADQSVIGMNAGGNTDDSIQPDEYRVSRPDVEGGAADLVDSLWTRSSFPGQPGSNGFNGLNAAHQFWEWRFPMSGQHGRKKVSGIVIDANGNPVSGATVKLFNTATGLLVDTQTSAAGGSFTCGDPNAVTCFAVADLAGSPETAGTTVQNLTGT